MLSFTLIARFGAAVMLRVLLMAVTSLWPIID